MVKIVFNKNENKSIAYDNDIQIGECDFEELDNATWNIIHTEVDNSYRGQKIAQVESIIEKANANKKNLVADCSYAKKIINK